MKLNFSIAGKSALMLIAAGTCFYTNSKAQTVPQPPKMSPEMTEFWEPEVKVITPGAGTAAPSDAMVLFNGKDMSQWKMSKDNSPAAWEVKNGYFIEGRGSISTKKDFEDFQLHIEWSIPTDITGSSQGRGNSGIFLQDRYELQVLDSYNNRSYANGQAASMYKQFPPLVNVMRKPGEWNVYDVVYTAPRFKADGSLFTPGKVTVLHNGVLVQNNSELKGPTEYIGLPKYKAHGKAPLSLQDHGNNVQFRNIWIREL